MQLVVIVSVLRDLFATPEESRTEPELAETTKPVANPVVQINCYGQEEQQLTLRSDGRVAVDATLPGMPGRLAEWPGLQHDHRLDPGRVTVT